MLQQMDLKEFVEMQKRVFKSKYWNNMALALIRSGNLQCFRDFQNFLSLD